MKLRVARKLLGSRRLVTTQRYMRASARAWRAWCTANPHKHVWGLISRRCRRCGVSRVQFVEMGEECPSRMAYKVLAFTPASPLQFRPPFLDGALEIQKFLDYVYKHLAERMAVPPALWSGQPKEEKR